MFLDNDECFFPNTCQDNSTCNNTIGSFECICYAGFTANGSQCEGVVKRYSIQFIVP